MVLLGGMQMKFQLNSDLTQINFLSGVNNETAIIWIDSSVPDKTLCRAFIKKWKHFQLNNHNYATWNLYKKEAKAKYEDWKVDGASVGLQPCANECFTYMYSHMHALLQRL